jgi:N-methylhydantoinase A
MAQHSYRIGIDIGGTFTDIVVARDDGLIETRKVPSTPDDYSRGIAQALKALVQEYSTPASSMRPRSRPMRSWNTRARAPGF